MRRQHAELPRRERHAAESTTASAAERAPRASAELRGCIGLELIMIGEIPVHTREDVQATTLEHEEIDMYFRVATRHLSSTGNHEGAGEYRKEDELMPIVAESQHGKALFLQSQNWANIPRF